MHDMEMIMATTGVGLWEFDHLRQVVFRSNALICMLGGDADREVSRAHARELLSRGADDSVAAVAGASSGVAPRAATPRGAQRRGKPV
ncbi:MAG: hypothetical protein ACOVRP_12830, partial [Gemmatimonas sp.]